MAQISHRQLGDFLERLPRFLEGLRAQGYKVGTRQHIAVNELVGELVARDSLPGSLADLGGWLAPLLCTTPDEQADFRAQLDCWLLDNRFVEPPPPPPPPPPPQPPPGEEKSALQ